LATPRPKIAVGADPLAPLNGQRLRHGDVLHHADQRHDQRRQGKLAERRLGRPDPVQGRQAALDGADDDDALFSKAEADDGQRRQPDNEQRHQPDGEARRALGNAETGEQRGERIAVECHREQAGNAELGRGRQLPSQQVPEEIGQFGQTLDAEDMVGLAGNDQDRRTGQEALRHRPAEQLGEETKAQQAGQHQQGAGHQRQAGGERHVFRRLRHGERRQHGQRHDRSDRHRPDGLHHRTADPGIGQGGQDADVKPGLRWQPGEQRVGEALRQCQHGDDQPGDDIVGQVRARIVAQPGGQEEEGPENCMSGCEYSQLLMGAPALGVAPVLWSPLGRTAPKRSGWPAPLVPRV
jgi:hypothetical protein